MRRPHHVGEAAWRNGREADRPRRLHEDARSTPASAIVATANAASADSAQQRRTSASRRGLQPAVPSSGARARRSDTAAPPIAKSAGKENHGARVPNKRREQRVAARSVDAHRSQADVARTRGRGRTLPLYGLTCADWKISDQDSATSRVGSHAQRRPDDLARHDGREDRARPIPVTKEYRRSDSSPVPKRMRVDLLDEEESGRRHLQVLERPGKELHRSARESMLLAMASSSSQSDGLAKYCHDAQRRRRARPPAPAGASRMSIGGRFRASSLGRCQTMERRRAGSALDRREAGRWTGKRDAPRRGAPIDGRCMRLLVMARLRRGNLGRGSEHDPCRAVPVHRTERFGAASIGPWYRNRSATNVTDWPLRAAIATSTVRHGFRRPRRPVCGLSMPSDRPRQTAECTAAAQSRRACR